MACGLPLHLNPLSAPLYKYGDKPDENMHNGRGLVKSLTTCLILWGEEQRLLKARMEGIGTSEGRVGKGGGKMRCLEGARIFMEKEERSKGNRVFFI